MNGDYFDVVFYHSEPLGDCLAAALNSNGNALQKLKDSGATIVAVVPFELVADVVLQTFTVANRFSKMKRDAEAEELAELAP